MAKSGRVGREETSEPARMARSWRGGSRVQAPCTLGGVLRARGIPNPVTRNCFLTKVVVRWGGGSAPPQWATTHPAVAWRGALRAASHSAASHSGAAPSAAASSRAWAQSRPRARGG